MRCTHFLPMVALSYVFVVLADHCKGSADKIPLNFGITRVTFVYRQMSTFAPDHQIVLMASCCSFFSCFFNMVFKKGIYTNVHGILMQIMAKGFDKKGAICCIGATYVQGCSCQTTILPILSHLKWWISMVASLFLVSLNSQSLKMFMLMSECACISACPQNINKGAHIYEGLGKVHTNMSVRVACSQACRTQHNGWLSPTQRNTVM